MHENKHKCFRSTIKHRMSYEMIWHSNEVIPQLETISGWCQNYKITRKFMKIYKNYLE